MNDESILKVVIVGPPGGPLVGNHCRAPQVVEFRETSSTFARVVIKKENGASEI